MIEQLKAFPDNVAAFMCHGHVTRKDYETVLIPALDKVLEGRGKVRLFYETAQDFAGFEPGALWEDFKAGIEHLARWERIAVVTDIDWIKHTLQLFSFVVPARVEIFPTAKGGDARKWILAND
ncbi:MAG TPA: STAS/SEC14 domain-containing protein [Bryobacteraceae bacterium]|jgi:hypothetical protein